MNAEESSAVRTAIRLWRYMRSFGLSVMLCGLGLPVFGSDFYQQFLSVVDTNQHTQPFMAHPGFVALPGLADTNNTGIKVTNAAIDLVSLKQSGEISRVRLGMTMQEVVDVWGKPKAGWSRCLHGLVTFFYSDVSLGFESNRLETINFFRPTRLAFGLSRTSQVEDFIRVLGAPTSRYGRNLSYLSANANLRLLFFDERLGGIYLEHTASRAEPWKQAAGANPQSGANAGSRRSP